jgi:transcriptional regulator with XRE-family HTH domain
VAEARGGRPDALAAAVLKRRHDREWSQKQLAVESGLSKNAVSAVEQGVQTRPQTATLSALDRGFGVPSGTSYRILVGELRDYDDTGDETVRILAELVKLIEPHRHVALLEFAQYLATSRPAIRRGDRADGPRS